MVTSNCALLLPGAKAPTSRHPNDDRGVQCAGILPPLVQTFPGCPVLGRGQKRQAPGSAVLSAFPGLLELSDQPVLSLPEVTERFWRPIGGDRRPWTLTVLGDSHGTIRKPGDG